LRISFFGGGTDLPSFINREFGCVINTTINKYIYLLAHKSFNEKNILVYSKREEVSDVEDILNTRIKEAMKRTGVTKNIEIHSIAEVPAGTGLGSSSSFMVGLLNLLYGSKGKFLSKEQLAKEASEIEVDILKSNIGKQDQYAAAIGGMNFIRFNTDGTVKVEPIKATSGTLKKINDRLCLFYLNKTRDASAVLMEQNKNIYSDEKKFNCMRKMKDITLKMKEELNNNNITNFGKMLHESWLLKKSLAESISSSYIDSIYERGLNAGATGGKVLGAGGGGFILFYCEPDKQNILKSELKELKELKIEFNNEGTKIIYLTK
jgi:D-glycero-alpha-D-manno-heptose-7-phosphate kinase